MVIQIADADFTLHPAPSCEGWELYSRENLCGNIETLELREGSFVLTEFRREPAGYRTLGGGDTIEKAERRYRVAKNEDIPDFDPLPEESWNDSLYYILFGAAQLSAAGAKPKTEVAS
ncbi:MAG: hypothetical protein AAFQ39_13970 [Pseudomonadota bacterium]